VTAYGAEVDVFGSFAFGLQDTPVALHCTKAHERQDARGITHVDLVGTFQANINVEGLDAGQFGDQ
jgi:hypothetical protein